MSHAALFVGLATLDIVQQVDALPAPNEKTVAHGFCINAGGPATNAAVAFAACGGEPTLVTALGDHPLSGVIESDLAQCGVRLSTAARYPGPPITATILVTAATGDRAVVSPSGVARGLSSDFARESAVAGGSSGSAISLDGVTALLIDGYFPDLALPLAARARAAGVPVILDGGSHKPHTDRMVAACDIAVVSDDFIPPGRTGEPEDVFAYLAAHGATTAVITRGAGEVLYRTPTLAGSVAIAPVFPVIDTLGAGDFFHGALTWRIASLGRDDARLTQDIAFASRVVARSLGSLGTRAWLER